MSTIIQLSSVSSSGTGAAANANSESGAGTFPDAVNCIPSDFKSTLPPRKRAKTKEEKEQRRIERILRNRKAAHQSREKKRLHLLFLERKCTILESILSKIDNLESVLQDDQPLLREYYNIEKESLHYPMNVSTSVDTLAPNSALSSSSSSTPSPHRSSTIPKDVKKVKKSKPINKNKKNSVSVPQNITELTPPSTVISPGSSSVMNDKDEDSSRAHEASPFALNPERLTTWDLQLTRSMYDENSNSKLLFEQESVSNTHLNPANEHLETFVNNYTSTPHVSFDDDFILMANEDATLHNYNHMEDTFPNDVELPLFNEY